MDAGWCQLKAGFVYNPEVQIRLRLHVESLKVYLQGAEAWMCSPLMLKLEQRGRGAESRARRGSCERSRMWVSLCSFNFSLVAIMGLLEVNAALLCNTLTVLKAASRCG